LSDIRTFRLPVLDENAGSRLKIRKIAHAANGGDPAAARGRKRPLIGAPL
jgi:hypothetical protein